MSMEDNVNEKIVVEGKLLKQLTRYRRLEKNNLELMDSASGHRNNFQE
jgi:hypothetical protein